MADQPEIFELNNGTMRVLITNLGCTITSLSVPSKDGTFLSFFVFFCFSKSILLSVIVFTIGTTWAMLLMLCIVW